MSASPSTSGTTSPSVGSYWYDTGSNVSISATAFAGHEFLSWSGSGTGSYSGTSSTATITMNSPISQTASFDFSPTTLLSGWNLVSFPLTNPSVSNIDCNLDDLVFYEWDTDTQKWEILSVGNLSLFKTIAKKPPKITQNSELHNVPM